MASISDRGVEFEPEEKDRQTVIQFYLEAFKHYIAENVDHKDLMFYEGFDLSKRREFRDLARTTSNSDVVLQMIDSILGEIKDPCRFTNLVDGEFAETQNDKVLSILRGEKLPIGDQDRSHYKKLCTPEIRDRLDVPALLPYLVSYGVITCNDEEQIANTAQGRSRAEAALDLILMVGKRHECWFVYFMMSLIDIEQKHLAEKLDKQLCDEIIKKRRNKEAIIGGDMSRKDTDLSIAKELTVPYSSLAPTYEKSYVPGKTWYPASSQTVPKEYETGIKTVFTMKHSSFGPCPSFKKKKLSKRFYFEY